MTGFSNGHFGKAFHIWSVYFHKAVGMTEVIFSSHWMSGESETIASTDERESSVWSTCTFIQ